MMVYSLVLGSNHHLVRLSRLGRLACSQFHSWVHTNRSYWVVDILPHLRNIRARRDDAVGSYNDQHRRGRSVSVLSVSHVPKISIF